MDMRGFVRAAPGVLLLSSFSFQPGCGTAVVTDSVAAQPVSDPSTGISAGIYSGKVTCQYMSQNTVQGVVDNYPYDFNETVVFTNAGLPEAGVLYDPENDQLELFGTTFDVTNRTFSLTPTGYVENAALVGNIDGDRVNGIWTWTFRSAGIDAIRYQLDIVWTYRDSGVAWTISEDCSGLSDTVVTMRNHRYRHS